MSQDRCGDWNRYGGLLSVIYFLQLEPLNPRETLSKGVLGGSQPELVREIDASLLLKPDPSGSGQREGCAGTDVLGALELCTCL